MAMFSLRRSPNGNGWRGPMIGLGPTRFGGFAQPRGKGPRLFLERERLLFGVMERWRPFGDGGADASTGK